MNATLAAITEDQHAEAVEIERSLRKRIVLTRGEIRVNDIIDFELVTAITNIDPVTGQPTADVRLRYGQEWTPLYAASEIVSVHR